MNAAARPIPSRPRGLSLLELVLALAMTTLVASGVAGMLAGLGSGIAVGRDARTAMLATAASQRRITDRLADQAAILETDDAPARAVLWAGDLRTDGAVEASELFWLSADDPRELVLERIVFPADWTTLERAMTDRRLGPGDDPWTMLGALRTRGVVERSVLADGLTTVAFTSIDAGRGLRIDLAFDLPTGRRDATVVVPVRGDDPEIGS